MKKPFLVVLTMFLVVLSLGNFVASAKGNNATVETGEVVVEDLSYEEAMQRIAKYSGRSLEEVKKEQPKTQKSLKALSATCSYSEVSQRLSVSGTYKPRFIAIVNKCRDGSFGWVSDIRYAGLDRYHGVSKQFSGDVQAWVKNNQQGIEYLVNGDFYDNGSTTLNFQTGIDTPVFKATFSVANASNHYRYFYSGYQYLSVTGN
ncbi:hypothetical protein AAFJ72_05820 [Brevibacillus gelatini]|uniref:hypothetical protein n=1 Tax=Brevibacillus gelatini TaxID=1655277 RepID=UPI003D8160D8